MKINVLILGANRFDDLERFVMSMIEQNRLPDALIIGLTANEEETKNFVQNKIGIIFPVFYVSYEPSSGPMLAMQAALKIMLCDIVAITHEDAAPRSDWLLKIENAFKDNQNLAGVGGTDMAIRNAINYMTNYIKVGRVTWCGKIIANHHFLTLGRQYVDFLPTVNCAYRYDLLLKNGFDLHLRWQQVTAWYWELALGLRLKKLGLKLLFDPEIIVDHFPGKLFSEKKDGYWFSAEQKRAHNQTYVIMSFLPRLKGLLYLVRSFFIGSKDSFGLVQAFRYLPNEGAHVFTKMLDSFKGHYEGVKSWHATMKHL